MLNRIVLAGRIGKEPELRYTTSGVPVTSFPMAVDRDFKDKETGEKATDWIDIVVWRSSAEYVTRYAEKGKMIMVDGRLQIRDWTDKDGNKRRAAEVVAESVYFPGSRKENTEQSRDAPQQFTELEDPDGELPF